MPTVKIAVELEEWQVDILMRHIPEGVSGPSVSDRAWFLLDDWCLGMKHDQEARARGERRVDDIQGDDVDIPF